MILIIASNSVRISVPVLSDLDSNNHTYSTKESRTRYCCYSNCTEVFKIHLYKRFQFVEVKQGVFTHKGQTCSSTGSLFSLYMFPFGNVIRKHCMNLQCYIDDSLLYLSALSQMIQINYFNYRHASSNTVRNLGIIFDQDMSFTMYM